MRVEGELISSGHAGYGVGRNPSSPDYPPRRHEGTKKTKRATKVNSHNVLSARSAGSAAKRFLGCRRQTRPAAPARGAPSDWPYPSRPTSSGQPPAVSYQLSGCNPYYKGIRTCRSGSGSADRIAVKFNRKSVFIRVHLWFQVLWTPPDYVACYPQISQVTRRSQSFS